ncbi:hypothetical protein [Candidatus Propionivibrio aalborgensis]|uniref:hypothetical protein n=1 Tax=Candidatus Propionivibrio aalborgensis TaxID=1860101 RepID=UPI00164832D2|nr:hypothetical protein [Candidatus Propionivibrio aalborgensis]
MLMTTGNKSATAAIGRLLLERQQQCALPPSVNSPEKFWRDKSERQLLELPNSHSVPSPVIQQLRKRTLE